MDFLQIRSLLLTFTSGRRHFFPMFTVVITATHLIYEVINFSRIFLFQKGQIALQFQQIHCLFMRQVLFCPQLILRRVWLLFYWAVNKPLQRDAESKVIFKNFDFIIFASMSQFHFYLLCLNVCLTV